MGSDKDLTKSLTKSLMIKLFLLSWIPASAMAWGFPEETPQQLVVVLPDFDEELPAPPVTLYRRLPPAYSLLESQGDERPSFLEPLPSLLRSPSPIEVPTTVRRSWALLRQHATILQQQAQYGSVNEDTPPQAPTIPQSHYAYLNIAVPRNPEVMTHYQDAEQSLQQKVDRHYISSELFDLKKDFEMAESVLNEVKVRPYTPGFYRVNYDFIAKDPYFYRHSKDIHHIYPEPIDDAQWGEILRSLQNNPEVGSLANDLEVIFRGVMMDEDDEDDDENKIQTKQSIRKRVKRLFESARDKTEAGGHGVQTSTPLGDLALRLSSHLDRCLDGFQSGLADLEKEHFQEGNPDSAGDFMSRVFTEYKMKFIDRHAELDPRPEGELRTTAPQVLRQRMLYSLGLRGTEAEISYPHLGAPSLSELKPGRVMGRFLAGERVQLPYQNYPTVEFESYNVDKMVRLLQESRERARVNEAGTALIHSHDSLAVGQKLTSHLIQEMAFSDPILADAYTEFFTDMDAPNEYFEKAPAGDHSANFRVKDRFWLYLMEREGYIIR